MPQPSAEHHEGLDFNFDWDLEAQNANLFGAESENREREGSRGHSDVAEWNERHVEEVGDRQGGSFHSMSAIKGNFTQQPADK